MPRAHARFAITLLARAALGAMVLAMLVSCKKRAGASCSTEREAECSANTAAMTCLDHAWRELSCRGPKGCATVNNMVDCDQSLATENDSCETDGNFACAVDLKSTLRCDKTHWVTAHACPKSCSVKDRVVDCD